MDHAVDSSQARCVQVLHGRVEWIETDAAGIYHYTNAFRWLEAAEAALYRRHGLLEEWRGMVRRHLDVNLIRALSFNDEYVVELWPQRVETSSVSLAFTVRANGDVCVHGTLVCVNVDASFEPAPLPERVRAMFMGTL